MGVVANEPSMEDILSSIKRIIADGSDRSTAPRVPRRRPAEREDSETVSDSDTSDSDSGEIEMAMEHNVPVDDQDSAVLELTDMIEEEAEIVETVAVEPERDIAPQPRRKAPAPTTAEPQAGAILSDISAQAARQSLSQLSSLLVRPQEGESNTLEGLVQDMLRPMLKDWLDARLPAMVETLVKKEIDRIVGRLV